MRAGRVVSCQPQDGRLVLDFEDQDSSRVGVWRGQTFVERKPTSTAARHRMVGVVGENASPADLALRQRLLKFLEARPVTGVLRRSSVVRFLSAVTASDG